MQYIFCQKVERFRGLINAIIYIIHIGIKPSYRSFRVLLFHLFRVFFIGSDILVLHLGLLLPTSNDKGLINMINNKKPVRSYH